MNIVKCKDAQIAILNERIKELMAKTERVCRISTMRVETIVGLEAEIAQYKAISKESLERSISENKRPLSPSDFPDCVLSNDDEHSSPPSPPIAERNTLICGKCGIDRMKADCKLGHPVDCGISGVAQGSFPVERKDDALRQQVIDTLTAIGLPSVMMSGERACQLLRELLVAARGNQPAIGQSIGHPIGHGEPVHDMGCTG